MRRILVLLTVLVAVSANTASAQRGQAEGSSRPTLPLEIVTEPWIGGFSGMVTRRRIRILTPYSRTHYFVDNGVQRGLAYDAGVRLEFEINRKLRTTSATRIHVVFVPAPRDELFRWLIEGRGDLIGSNIVITTEASRLVDFMTPAHVDAKQVLVTGPATPAVRSLADLSGLEIGVREGSVERESLEGLSAELTRQGRAAIVVRALPAALEDEDLLEMVNAGLLKATVVDEIIGRFWIEVLPDLKLRPDIVVRQNVAIAWAARKGSPELAAAVNPIIEANRVGTAFGNTTLAKYLRRAKVVRRATAAKEVAKFRSLTAIFRKYSAQYDLDHLLMMAQGFQESGLNQQARSHVGAIGIMQVMPATAKDMNTGDVRLLEPNVHAGIKYIRWIADRHFADEGLNPLNKTLFALAAYNCGAGRLQGLRDETGRRGLNPNEWFNNVERITAERIGQQTVQYVSNIYKYYIAYKLAEERSRVETE